MSITAKPDDGPDNGLAATLSRITEAYEALPYSSNPIPASHPGRMAAIARVFGLEAPSVKTARVLELGCAAGGNLIPIAAFHPDCECLGIDLGPRQIADGQARIAALGLGNVTLRCESITDFPEDAGLFDYIICHGVFSWVPEPVQQAIFAVIRRHLSPTGVGYISYNVLPGWRMFAPLRDAIRVMIPPTLDDMTRVRMARELLDLMKDASPDRSAYGDLLREAPDRLRQHGDDYLFHEYLEETNEAFAFRDIIAAAGEHQLGYLGDTFLHSMLPESLGEEHARKLRDVTAPDVNSIEQMMDVLTGRTFRRTLLVHSDRVTQIERHIVPERLDGLHLLPDGLMRMEIKGDAVQLVDKDGRKLASREPAVRKLAERLVAARMSSLDHTALIASFPAAERNMVAGAIFRMVTIGMLALSSEPMESGVAVARPRASAISRDDAAAGRELTVSQRHEAVQIDPIARIIMPYLDGQTGRETIEEVLIDHAQAGKLRVEHEGRVITARKELKYYFRDKFPRFIAGIANAGLLDKG